jgi:N-acetylmuramoyl-L-alanine amidase
MLHLPRKQHGEDRARSMCARWWRAGLLLLMAFCAALASDPAEPHHVTAVRFWSLGNVTRIAIETDGDFQVRSDRLDNPDRIFFDLEGTKPTLSRKALTVIPVSDRFVQRIRVAEPQRNVTRVVLDLESAVETSISRLDNPSRLIVELRAPGKGAETSKPPARTAPVIVEPTPRPPAPRPAVRRPFKPPPPAPAAPAQAAPTARAQEAALDTPPVLSSKEYTTPAPVVALSYQPEPAPVAPVPPAASGILAKATVPEESNPLSGRPALNAPVPDAPVRTTTPAPAEKSASSPPETAFPAKRNSTGGRSMIRVLGLKVDRIVLDPGHGGHDTGTVGPQGLREKDLVLDVAERLGRLIEEKMGSEVIYTRSDDTFVPLERRTEIANEAKADLFLSIHANSSPLRSAAGVETFYLNFTTSRSALEVAARENSGSQMSIYDLQDLLQKIALKDKVEESREFAAHVQSALYRISARTTDARSKDRGVKKAPFVVLIGASMPSVLAEIGFISNARDESIMRREEYRRRTAEALYKGISSYASTLSHFQVAQRH